MISMTKAMGYQRKKAHKTKNVEKSATFFHVINIGML